jgi:hypothetical protein
LKTSVHHWCTLKFDAQRPEVASRAAGNPEPVRVDHNQEQGSRNPMPEHLDEVGQRYRFWLLIARHAPEVMMSLFENYAEPEEADDDALLRHQALHAHQWCDLWKLPEWCGVRAQAALSEFRPTRMAQTWNHRTKLLTGHDWRTFEMDVRFLQ